MDSVSERILARARERQRLLENYPNPTTPSLITTSETSDKNSPKSLSQPNLIGTNGGDKIKATSISDTNLIKKCNDSERIVGEEGNISFITRQTRVSSEITTSSPLSPKSSQKLNIKNDNFNMEIKVTSLDNVRVEVQIDEETSESPSKGDCNQIIDKIGKDGLRPDAKNRLNRLGKLYGSNNIEDAEISSPIHRTEGKFHVDNNQIIDDKSVKNNETDKPKKGLKKLADLAENINQWEDDLTHIKLDKQEKTKKTWKPPAPQPPTNTPPKSSVKPQAPTPPKIGKDTKGEVIKSLKWDEKVLENLESQGFTRTTSSSRLVYKYDSQNNNNNNNNNSDNCSSNKENTIKEEEIQENLPKQKSKIADKTAIFEANSNTPPANKQKDPALLSVSERKALFEKNKGAALVPKAPFAMATPVKNDNQQVKKSSKKSPAPKPPTEKPTIDVKPTVIQSKGVASTVAALLENKTTISQTQIENNIRQQRRKEMEVLLNRFNKNKEVVVEQEDDDLEDSDEKTAMIPGKQLKIVSPPPPPPPLPSNSTTTTKRRSNENQKCKGDSPKVVEVLSDVKRIKVAPKKTGRLYPSLTDIESTTETENDGGDDDDDNLSTNESSFNGSCAESDEINTSFGRDILQTVCNNQTPQKRQILDTSSDMSDILDGDDDYIDEALADDPESGPTPPKHYRQDSNAPQQSNSFNYKSFNKSEFTTPTKLEIKPRKSEELPFVIDGDNILPLTHTVSFYRKQQQQSNTTTPIRQIIRQPIIEEIDDNIVNSNNNEQIKIKIKQLQNEVNKQQTYIAQASQALNVCNSRPEFVGSPEQVEAEKLLLIATHRRQAALHELQRLEVENNLRPQGLHSKNLPIERGTLTISKIILPLKQKYVTALAAAGGKGHHVVCLIKCGEQVVDTQLVSTVVTNKKNPDLDLIIPGIVKLNDIYSDFTITFEVYCLQAQEEIVPHEIKYHINKKATNKLTPKKTRMIGPVKESPAGPQVVRSSTFTLMGYVVFSVQAINKKHWSLNNTPSMSPLEGTVQMQINCELAVSVEHRGFLTMFEDVSGFGAWHRRWYLLKGHTLSYWKYPDDEKKIPPIDTINLKSCITKKVESVSREICARLHTFLLERERPAHPQDRDSLVMVLKGETTIIRHLLSADTKEERIEWCNKLNAALTALRMWGDKRE